MAKQVLVHEDERKLLEEILVRIRALQDAYDEDEIEAILREPKYRRALREAEADIKFGRERDLASFLRDLRKA
jgi:citrate lyase beta subunit